VRGDRRAQLIAVLVLSCLAVAPVSASAAEPEPFGITKFTIEPTERTVEEEGKFPPFFHTGDRAFVNVPYKTPFTQAGGHPWALTTRGEVTTREFHTPGGHILQVVPTRDPKDIVTSLPPGLLGDPMAVPRCALSVVTTIGANNCPADTQVGVYMVHKGGGVRLLAPIVNVTPEAGQSAEFALANTTPAITPLLTAHLVHTTQGYGFTVVSNEIPLVGVYSFELTFWGVPGDPSHDPMRGLICKDDASVTLGCEGGNEPFGYSPVVPFLTLGTDCSAGPEPAVVRVDSWEEPGTVREGLYSGYAEAQARMPGVTGCDLLQFGASVGVQPDTLLADEPVGLGVDVNVPLSETPESSATPQLRDTVLTLPEGMSVSPGVVDGIRACEASGPEGINIEGPESEEVGLNGELQLAPGHCPDASIVGTAEAITPFLPVPVKGHVYLARPGCGGAGQAACTEQDALSGNLYRLYLELGGTGELAQTGVHFKVALQTSANPATGQLTTRTLGTPQAPFSELKIHLNGGPRAPIDNPAVCGPALTTADLTPWSAPGVTPEGLAMPGTPDATSSSFFDVAGCANPPGLNPGFLAGTVSPQAGAFSAFTLNFTRQDREQYLKGIQVHTPPGLLGMLSSVTLCQEPDAQSGHCPEASKIGTTRVASGAGSHPFEISGNVFLTTGYRGAPFGLSIVTDAVAGPFNLGLVVVRARIDVDPSTSQLTVTSDPLPQIVFGVPLRLKQISVNIDRPGFMFNPTNCGAPGQPGVQQVAAAVSGDQNAIASVSSKFAAGGCKSLDFKPRFTVSTSGHTSKANGASLDAKVVYPPFKAGSEANIAYVKVSLPKQLPSRLTTLQGACTAAQFGVDPAGCPAASVVGIARASTPLLPVGLEGPAYFVSHGGEAFPSLIVVLQGDGVRVDLTGATFIDKRGITSSTFKTVPDVPVSSFELYLPQGRFSALAANTSLCKAAGKLKMPTEMIAQNGAVIRQITHVVVTGCATGKARAAKHRSRGRRKRGHATRYRTIRR
jgi:hypothetical protein